MRPACLAVSLALVMLVLVASAHEASAVTLERVGDFTSPVGVTSDPGDPDRLFVTQKDGRVVLVEGGSTTTFLDLSGLVYTGDETGLMSIALAPDFATTGRLYAYYVRDQPDVLEGPDPGDGDLQIDEFTAAGGQAPLSSRRPVMTIPMHEPHDPPTSIHNGGQLQFGPDGLLYVTVGDGAFTAAAGDPFELAQDRGSRFGKVLRIDPQQAGSEAYSIPADNPFADGAGGAADEIWSLGLRNPWRLTFDRVTGAMVIGDVGHNSWEEINWLPGPRAGAGVNFGWDCREGSHPFEPGGDECSGLTDPVFEYPHRAAGPSSVTTGHVVRDPELCGLEGRLLYADVFTGDLRSQVPALPEALDDAAIGLVADWPVSFGEDAAGRIYVVSLFHPGFEYGSVYRLEPSPGECDPPTAPRCAGVQATISGKGRLIGTRGPDVIAGSAAGDTIKGRGGRDVVCAGGGDDRVRGGGGADRLKGGPGGDRLSGGGDADRCRGGPGRDDLRSC